MVSANCTFFVREQVVPIGYLMTKRETWELLVALGAVEEESTQTAWNLRQADLSEADLSEADLSEVDLTDSDDVRVTVADPKGAVLVHLRSPNFLEPFQVYMTHIQEWRSQFPRLESLDLRFSGQVIVNPDAAAQHAVGTTNPQDTTAGSTTATNSATPSQKSVPTKKTKKH